MVVVENDGIVVVVGYCFRAGLEGNLQDWASMVVDCLVDFQDFGLPFLVVMMKILSDVWQLGMETSLFG